MRAEARAVCAGVEGVSSLPARQPASSSAARATNIPQMTHFNESFLTLGFSNLKKFCTLQFLKVNLIRAFHRRSRSFATYIRDVQLFLPPLPFEMKSKPQWFHRSGGCCVTHNICKQLIFQMGDSHHRCRPLKNKH